MDLRTSLGDFPLSINLPGTWNGSRFANESEYIYRLSAREIQETKDALCYFKGYFILAAEALAEMTSKEAQREEVKELEALPHHQHSLPKSEPHVVHTKLTDDNLAMLNQQIEFETSSKAEMKPKNQVQSALPEYSHRGRGAESVKRAKKGILPAVVMTYLTDIYGSV
ncbi:unnamed protein product [Fusarium equiseti]|uniref:Uncharacterized protein n=1 Tax=Fusarium equiseti TaxID=61235 RepID=A0A8J2IZA6_FUSEQ|nr:unnamed protein product [Fusarium equiseti]